MRPVIWANLPQSGLTERVSELIPSDYAHLLELPLYGHLGTIRPDDTVQVNPMWFEYDGTNLRFTHTTKRAKYRNLQHNPAMSLSIIDPDNNFRYLELRGKLVDVEPDPTGAFYVRSGSVTAMPISNRHRTARIGSFW